MTWDDRKIASLRALWPGYSAADIGKTLGVTRNAVIGKAYHLGLQDKNHFRTDLESNAARIIYMYTSGFTLWHIGIEFASNPTSIRRLLVRHGVKLRSASQAQTLRQARVRNVSITRT